VLVDSAFNARIADFGHTVSLTSTGMNSTTSQSGTAAYMAPELLDCSESATEESQRPSTHSDVYALGILIWEVRTML
jgi:serine/threonine protein kinase